MRLVPYLGFGDILPLAVVAASLAVVASAGGNVGARAVIYEQVLTGTTGRAGAIPVVFDLAKVNGADLPRVGFSVVADPTTLNVQRPDHGAQYRLSRAGALRKPPLAPVSERRT